MSAQHTPRPWAAKMQFGVWHVRQDPVNWDGCGYQHICTLPAERKGSHYGDMFSANARLIAAAPDLLEALIAARPFINAWPQCRGKELLVVDAAIAKATGAGS